MVYVVAGCVIAFAAGAAVAWVNYRLNLYILKKKPNALARMSLVREALSIICLVAAYAVGGAVPGGRVPILIGAAVGLTVPSVLLSMKLAKINDALAQNAGVDPGKGEQPHE